MRSRKVAVALATALLLQGLTPLPAAAANPMGYRLLSEQEAASLPHRHGSLGLNVARAQRITDDGMTFEILRVEQVRRGSAGAQAGFAAGDQIVAVDGMVFPTLASFAAYIGSLPPGARARFDYIPSGGGASQAQRVVVTMGAAGQSTASSGGMSTREKIGLGAAALAGCYMLGCFSHRSAAPAPQQ